MTCRRQMLRLGARDERGQPSDDALRHVGRQAAGEQQGRHLDAISGIAC